MSALVKKLKFVSSGDICGVREWDEIWTNFWISNKMRAKMAQV